ncbi:terpene synthase family protein [Streptomyces sp. HU2014]|uniref:terpene synthase family protein n=1 Tax=Streptomyces sp. HU2014 TaxID=2939414 RepID=UPI00200E5994|nr:terpene synthase family protein [Streptomyces sp. HU2014]UQI45809.1 terpene synthase family protein [Streptomyces sp. HU2014]
MNPKPSHELIPQALAGCFPALDLAVDVDRAEELSRNMLEFAHRHCLADRKTLERLGKTACNCTYFLATYPNASKENQQLASDIYMWFTAFDDIHAERIDDTAVDSLARHAFELLDVLGGNTADPAVGFSSALAEILHRAEKWTLHQQGDLRNALCGALLSWQWEAQLRNTRSQPSVRTYMDARRHLAAGVLERAIAEQMGGYVLPDMARQDPQLIRLKQAFANIGGWVNDLCSYEKERRQEGDSSINLPNALMHEEDCTVSDAFTRTSELISQEAMTAAEMIQQLSESPFPEVRAYARDTQHMLRAQTAFYATAGFGRYTDS